MDHSTGAHNTPYTDWSPEEPRVHQDQQWQMLIEINNKRKQQWGNSMEKLFPICHKDESTMKTGDSTLVDGDHPSPPKRTIKLGGD